MRRFGNVTWSSSLQSATNRVLTRTLAISCGLLTCLSSTSRSQSAPTSCRVYCPNGTSFLVSCNTTVDPCASGGSGGSGGSRRTPPRGPSPAEVEAEREARLKAEEAEREARRRAEEAAEAAREEDARKQAAYEAEQKRQQEEQARFILDRDAAAAALKTPIGRTVTPNSDGLKSPLVDLGLKAPATDQRDLQGAQAAWKQLNCAAAISQGAFAALKLQSRTTTDLPQFEDFKYLAGEAINALNGAPRGVACPPLTSAVPAAFNTRREVPEQYKTKYGALLEYAKKEADVLRGARVKYRESLDDLIAAKTASTSTAGGTNGAVELEQLQGLRRTLGPPSAPKLVPRDKDPQTILKAAQETFDQNTKIFDAQEGKLSELKDVAGKVQAGTPEGLKSLDTLSSQLGWDEAPKSSLSPPKDPK